MYIKIGLYNGKNIPGLCIFGFKVLCLSDSYVGLMSPLGPNQESSHLFYLNGGTRCQAAYALPLVWTLSKNICRRILLSVNM